MFQSYARSFLGLVNYYSKFIPNLSFLCEPLNGLLRKEVTWNWDRRCKQAFQGLKRKLVSAQVLVHYDVSLSLKLECGASSYHGFGAAISHSMPDRVDKLIAYASRSLSSAEKNYSQLEKEALALIFGVKRFHQFLYGRSFKLITDHKPLATIFGDKQGIAAVSVARLQRWAVILAAYRYTISYK